MFRRLFLLLSTISMVYVDDNVTIINDYLKAASPVPKLDENAWWGQGKPKQEDTSIKRFKINIPDEIVKDLQHRLNNSRPFTPPLEGAKQHYGMNTYLLEEIVEFWKTKYDWRRREKFLNRFPQYTTQIQGLKIHFLHVKPIPKSGIRVLPLLILHGWPGSVREFYELIPILTTPQKDRNFVFEVIAPSLPGFGFSEGASKQGLGAIQIAVVFKKLMERLGFDKYYLQGGDWGATISKYMAILYSEKILGLHSNMCIVITPLMVFKLALGSIYPPLIVDKEYENLIYPLSGKLLELLLESGYFHYQATKPDTLGVGLKDSPAGLAAYILEKFITATNKAWENLTDGGLTRKFTYTQLLDNIMIYWVSGSITTSMRLYAESVGKNPKFLDMERIPTDVPSACAKFIHDIFFFPDSIIKEIYRNLVHSAVYDGGHYAAFEEPQLLAYDIFTAVKKFESFNTKS